MITNSPENLQKQKDKWMKIFDTFVDSIESYEDVNVGIEISADGYEELWHENFAIDITIEYKQFNLYLNECFESFVRAKEYINSSRYTYSGTAGYLLQENEKLTLENEALKSAVESKKRRM